MTADNTELRESFEKHANSEGLNLERIYEQQDTYSHYVTAVAWSAYQARDTELQAKLAAKDALLEEMAGILKQSQTCGMDGMDGHSCGICEALTKYEKEKENEQQRSN